MSRFQRIEKADSAPLSRCRSPSWTRLTSCLQSVSYRVVRNTSCLPPTDAARLLGMRGSSSSVEVDEAPFCSCRFDFFDGTVALSLSSRAKRVWVALAYMAVRTGRGSAIRSALCRANHARATSTRSPSKTGSVPPNRRETRCTARVVVSDVDKPNSRNVLSSGAPPYGAQAITHARRARSNRGSSPRSSALFIQAPNAA